VFEAAETGRRLSKAEFKRREPELHTRLLEAQRRLAGSDVPVFLIIAGVEGSGRGQVVNRLSEWLDARGLRTFAFWDESDEERERPFFWRFWRVMPARGTIGLFLGSWYTRPIIDRVFRKSTKNEFHRDLQRVRDLERMLHADHALVIKFWLHISREVQRQRLEGEARHGRGSGWRYGPFAHRFAKRYPRFLQVSEQVIRETDTGECPWYVIDAEDRRYRDYTIGTLLENAIRSRLDGEQAAVAASDARGVTRPDVTGSEGTTVLAKVDLSRSLTPQRYQRRLKQEQQRLNGLVWRAWEKRRNVVAMFEGWDAAGKGGAIRRLTAAVDARLYHVISVAAPTDEEKAHHYLWRFWRHIPRAGHFTIYDRSWYGRVLVERVEGFAAQHEWMRAYQEINDFEEQLVEHGVILLKFWIHISRDEQLRRFREREQVAWKKHKITDEDWRNREKWNDYEAAVNDMVLRTSTAYAPWTLIAGDDKRFARVQVLETVCNCLEAAL